MCRAYTPHAPLATLKFHGVPYIFVLTRPMAWTSSSVKPKSPLLLPCLGIAGARRTDAYVAAQCSSQRSPREKRAHLRAHEIPRLAVLHQVHLAEGALPEHLDRLILFHPFSCDLPIRTSTRYMAGVAAAVAVLYRSDSSTPVAHPNQAFRRSVSALTKTSSVQRTLRVNPIPRTGFFLTGLSSLRMESFVAGGASGAFLCSS